MKRCTSRIWSLRVWMTDCTSSAWPSAMVVLTQSSSRSAYRTKTRPPPACGSTPAMLSRVARSVCSSMLSQLAARCAEPSLFW
ncbi:hypothetical protein [Nocardioides houyundeii]|uniref:hypothetical protein n=1 Tax=Nocardioides houyundeii TaxID=2045452 RepID=UPI0013155E08|nr:hypothetical protein [Nocardioides houyundeii]